MAGNRHHVEVKLLKPVSEQREIDQPLGHRDAELFQVALPLDVAPQRLRFEDLKCQGLATGIAQLAVGGQGPTGGSQQVAGLAQVLAQRVRAGIGAWGDIGWAEHLRRQILAERLQQRHLSRRGQALGRKLGVVEQAVGALEGAVLVVVLEVKSQRQRPAHPDVLEQRSAQVEFHRRQALPGTHRKRVLQDAAIAPFRALVLAHPGTRPELLQDVVFAGLEGLARDRVVLVQPVDDTVKVEVAAPHAQVARPVVGVAFELQPARHLDLVDDIGATADRLLADDLVKRLACAPTA